MKLYMFQCGTIKTKKYLLVEGPKSDDEFIVPIPFFLIEHPEGKMLFDTGQPFSAVGAEEKGNYIPVMTEADYVSNQLERIGLKTTDITHIVLSHLHSDHAGGIGAFRDAICYLQEKEVAAGGGGSHDITKRYPLRWHLLQGDREAAHDIFGDGSVQIIFTPGHTPGHQSLFLKLEDWGPTLLASDSVYTDEILEREILPGVFSSRENTVRTIGMIQEMRRNGIRIITGHDPQSWAGFKLAPSYYE